MDASPRTALLPKNFRPELLTSDNLGTCHTGLSQKLEKVATVLLGLARLQYSAVGSGCTDHIRASSKPVMVVIGKAQGSRFARVPPLTTNAHPTGTFR